MNAENVELEEQLSLFNDEEVRQDSESSEEEFGEEEFSDELKSAITERMQKIYNDGMIVGVQTVCHTALNKIYAFESSPGKKSNNDHKRLLKDLKKFFHVGISRNVNSEKASESEDNSEETAQN
jgi:ribosome-binding ATPase YchF (GTP1/OBG family)